MFLVHIRGSGGVGEELDSLVLDEGPGKIEPSPVEEPSTWVDGEFVLGPLPLSWWTSMSKLRSGRAVPLTALAIWFLAGLRGRFRGLKLTSEVCERFGVDPSDKSRALKALEAAGLIEVVRNERKNPVVTVLNPGVKMVTRRSTHRRGSHAER
jgi:DNA-binding transcriptional ArsR family regulator